MNRYLIVFIKDGEFAVDTVMANNITRALEIFKAARLEYEEIYSVTRAS